MGEAEQADLYRVLGATSCDSVQHIKHKYQQLALQVSTHVSACSPEPRRWAVPVRRDPCAGLYSVPPGPVQRRQPRRSGRCSEEVSGNRCSLEDLKGPGKQEAV